MIQQRFHLSAWGPIECQLMLQTLRHVDRMFLKLIVAGDGSEKVSSAEVEEYVLVEGLCGVVVVVCCVLSGSVWRLVEA